MRLLSRFPPARRAPVSPIVPRLLLVAALVGGSFMALAKGTDRPTIPSAERQALMALYAHTGGDQWSQRAGWLGAAGTECAWYGVQCDAGQRHVVGLALANNQLRGRLPRLAALSQLQSLSVALNRLDGALPPLDELRELRVLKAHNNLLSGPLPSLRGLAQLEQLNLANNRISGYLPPLVGLAQLRVFDVSNNLLSGGVPGLTGLDKLQRFDASFNRLQLASSQLHSRTLLVELEGNLH